jgi:hypothetical protein
MPNKALAATVAADALSRLKALCPGQTGYRKDLATAVILQCYQEAKAAPDDIEKQACELVELVGLLAQLCKLHLSQ